MIEDYIPVLGGGTMAGNDSDFSGILAHVSTVKRAFGINRGLVIILLALWSARRRPQVTGVFLALASGAIALWKHHIIH